MAIKIGTVTGSSLGENLDSDSEVRLLQVEFAEDDIQEVELASHCGVDYVPVDESIAFIETAFESSQICIATDDGIVSEGAGGDYEIYSSDSGIKKTRVRCLADGSIIISGANNEIIEIKDGTVTITADVIELNGEADFAVRFNKLKEQFDALVQSVNDLINWYNTHTHIYTPGPLPAIATAPPAVPATPSTADISAAKVEEVKFS